MRRPAKSTKSSVDFTRTPKLAAARRKWLSEQVSKGRFTDIDEALNFCVGQAVRVEAAQAEFERAIAEGDKGPFERVDDAWWAGLRAETAAARTRSRRRSA